MLVLGFKLKCIQAEIKAQGTEECPNWSPWNVLMRMCRRRKKDRHLYIDDGMVKGTTNTESLDNQDRCL